jgi:hypothetical protein
MGVPKKTLSKGESPSGVCWLQQEIAVMHGLSSGMEREALQWTYVSELAELSGWSQTLQPWKEPSVLPGVAGTEDELTLFPTVGCA